MSIKNSNDTIGNRTRDLPACSAVPQPTAPPRAPRYYVSSCNINTFFKKSSHIYLVITLATLPEIVNVASVTLSA